MIIKHQNFQVFYARKLTDNLSCLHGELSQKSRGILVYIKKSILFLLKWLLNKISIQ